MRVLDPASGNHSAELTPEHGTDHSTTSTAAGSSKGRLTGQDRGDHALFQGTASQPYADSVGLAQALQQIAEVGQPCEPQPETGQSPVGAKQ